jgi:uncharacterized membrane protein (UPF0127 family)
MLQPSLRINRQVAGEGVTFRNYLVQCAVRGLWFILVAQTVLFPIAIADDRLSFQRRIITLQPTSGTAIMFDVETAITDAQQRHGLMNRTTLAPMTGMIFIFEQTQHRYFWMKNTPLSLDILFFDENGNLEKVVPEAKPNKDDIIASGSAVKYVLEIGAGEAQRLKIVPGTKLLLPIE